MEYRGDAVAWLIEADADTAGEEVAWDIEGDDDKAGDVEAEGQTVLGALRPPDAVPDCEGEPDELWHTLVVPDRDGEPDALGHAETVREGKFEAPTVTNAVCDAIDAVSAPDAEPNRDGETNEL